MNAPEDELVEHVVAQTSVQPLEIHADRARMAQQETKLDVAEWSGRSRYRGDGPIVVPAMQVTVMIPYTGDSQLWRLSPGIIGPIHPRGRIVNRGEPNAGTLVIEMTQPASEDVEKFRNRLDAELKAVEQFLGWQREKIDSFNAGLSAAARSAVQARRARLEKHTGLDSVLGIPMRHRGDAPEVAPLPLRRKLVRPLPPAPKSGYKPEPGIRDEDYEHILAVIRHEGRTFESTPRTYAVHDEEQLRDILLAHLNGHYLGDATGETFRKLGKTDIRIEDDNRAAFVAECKVWKGQKGLGKALEQLLGYLTWRDCKTAIVIFNKHNKEFSKILEGVSRPFETHPGFRKQFPTDNDGEWRFSMTSQEDPSRLVTVHVFIFNLYVK